MPGRVVEQSLHGGAGEMKQGCGPAAEARAQRSHFFPLSPKAKAVPNDLHDAGSARFPAGRMGSRAGATLYI